MNERKLKKLEDLKHEQNKWKNKQQEFFNSQYNITRNLTDILKPISQVKEVIKEAKLPQKLLPPAINKIDAETDPKPALEYHKPRAVREIADDGSLRYYDQDEIKNKEEDFAYFLQFAKQENCGYVLKNNDFYIGKSKITLKLNGEKVEVYGKKSKYTFYTHEFEDLFGSDSMPDFYDTIDKGTFFMFYYLLKECVIGKIQNTRNHPISVKGEFRNNLRELMTRKLSDEEETELLIRIYNDLTRNATLEHGKDFIENPDEDDQPVIKPEQKEPIIEGKGVIILPSSAKTLKHRLNLILAEIKAGNNSDELKNEVSAIVDELKKKKLISPRYEKMLLYNLL